jgi:hypothetical protein|tara:strand:- start:37 stop:234 length:198 start_codon:yes stop_codon:yes gene_type:complete
MKPSELAKKLGFRSLQEASDLVDVTPRTLTNWQASNPNRYLAIMVGASAIKQSQTIKQIILTDKV